MKLEHTGAREYTLGICSFLGHTKLFYNNNKISAIFI